MILRFKQNFGAVFDLNTMKPFVSKSTADDKATRIFQDGFTVRLLVTHENFKMCLATPSEGEAAGLCRIIRR